VEQETLAECDRRDRAKPGGAFKMMGKIGQYLRENEWLMAIKQRTSIPAEPANSICPLPLLAAPQRSQRTADLANWIMPLYPCATVRPSCSGSCAKAQAPAARRRPGHVLANAGRTNSSNGAHPPTARQRVIPEISANKYALNVRFTLFGMEPRPKLAEQTCSSS